MTGQQTRAATNELVPLAERLRYMRFFRYALILIVIVLILHEPDGECKTVVDRFNGPEISLVGPLRRSPSQPRGVTDRRGQCGRNALRHLRELLFEDLVRHGEDYVAAFAAHHAAQHQQVA